MTCPTCKRVIKDDSAADRPFCSARCRMADLGNWLSGNYRISTPASEEDLDQSSDPLPPPDDDRSHQPN